jgi:hypothetical protein
MTVQTSFLFCFYFVFILFFSTLIHFIFLKFFYFIFFCISSSSYLFIYFFPGCTSTSHLRHCNNLGVAWVFFARRRTAWYDLSYLHLTSQNKLLELLVGTWDRALIRLSPGGSDGGAIRTKIISVFVSPCIFSSVCCTRRYLVLLPLLLK